MSFINPGLSPFSVSPILLESPVAFWDQGRAYCGFQAGTKAREMAEPEQPRVCLAGPG